MSFFLGMLVVFSVVGSNDSICVQNLRLAAPHLFQNHGNGRTSLDVNRVATTFRESFFLNHPLFKNGLRIVGKQSNRKYEADGWISGDRTMIRYDFKFHPMLPSEDSFSPGLHIQYSRTDPLVWRVKPRLEHDEENRPMDLNLLKQVSDYFQGRMSSGTVWRIEISDFQTVSAIVQVLEDHYKLAVSGGFTLDEVSLRDRDAWGDDDNIDSDGSATDEPLLFHPMRAHISHEGHLWALAPTLSPDERAYIENNIVTDEINAPEFQAHAWQKIRALPFVQHLLPEETTSNPNQGALVRIIPIVQKNIRTRMDGVSFYLEVDFGW